MFDFDGQVDGRLEMDEHTQKKVHRELRRLEERRQERKRKRKEKREKRKRKRKMKMRRYKSNLLEITPHLHLELRI